jgi:hypothetical protein
VSDPAKTSPPKPSREQLEAIVQPVCDAIESIYDVLMPSGSFRREGGAFDNETQIAMSSRTKGMVNSENRREFAVRAKLAMTVSNSKKEVIAVINGDYLIRYETREGFAVTDEQADLYAQTNGIFNAWSYWREYVQASCSRMGIPAPPVPVYHQGLTTVTANLVSDQDNASHPAELPIENK